MSEEFQQGTVNHHKKPAKNPLAIAGMVVGIVGIVFSFIPVLGLLLCLTGLGLSIPGLIVGNKNGKNRGNALAGIIVSGVGLLIAFIVTVSFFVVAAGVANTIEESPIDQQTQQSEIEATPEEAPVEESGPAAGSTGYEAIYNEYAEKLRAQCPTLSMMDCATLSNEGITKMATYMYGASGTDGQYSTYEEWAGKLQAVYMESVR